MQESDRQIYPTGPGQRRGDVARVDAGGGEHPATVYLCGYGARYRVRAARTPEGSALLSVLIEPLGDAPLTGEDLAVDPQRLAAAAVWAGAILPGDDHGPIGGEPEQLDWARFARPEPRKVGRPVERGPEHYAEVAQVARAAWLDRRPARDEIAARWQVAGQTADRWIRTARELGLLESYAEVRARRGAPPVRGEGDGGR